MYFKKICCQLIFESFDKVHVKSHCPFAYKGTSTIYEKPPISQFGTFYFSIEKMVGKQLPF